MKKFFPGYVWVPIAFFSVAFILELAIDAGNLPALMTYPLLLLSLLIILVVLVAIHLTSKAINNVSYYLMSDEEKQMKEVEANISFTEKEWYQNLMQKLTKSEPLENEESLLLHHDYDGIKELDNDLPPWWTWLFVISVIYAVFYFAKYQIMDGNSQEDEFQTEMALAKIQVDEYKRTAPDMMDENTVELLDDASALAAGKTIFESNCIACHRPDLGGSIGPNLTDSHWILGGTIKEIFHTISKGGRDGKGMVAWDSSLKPKEIQEVASYIISMKGSNPPEAKAAEGDIIIE